MDTVGEAAPGQWTATSNTSSIENGFVIRYYLTIAYNSVEAIVSIAAGMVAGSVALVGFGVDSGIEMTASVVAQWRLRADIDPVGRERAVYVAVDSVTTLWAREASGGPGAPQPGAHGRALEADAAQTSLCAYLSVIALAGVGPIAAFGWWWADPAAALVMVPIIGKEGMEGLRGETECECHTP